MLGPRDSPESAPRRADDAMVQHLALLSTPISRGATSTSASHGGIATRLDAAYEKKFESGVLTRRRVPSMSLSDSGQGPTRGEGLAGHETENEAVEASPKEAHTISSILTTPPSSASKPPVHRNPPAAFGSPPPARAALSPSQSLSSPSGARLPSPTSALSPRSSKTALAVRFLGHEEQAANGRHVGSNGVSPRNAGGEVSQNLISDGTKQTIRVATVEANASLPGAASDVEGSRSGWTSPLSPDSAKIFSTFTIYMKGYLKQKRLQRDNKEVVRGTGGERRYFVWHSKGLSMYASESEYFNDRKPLRQMLNAWNTKFGAEQLDEGIELPELILIPYDGGQSSTADTSDELIRNSHRDELLLRLILATPSALGAGVASLPANATLMVVKAPTSREAKEWLGASHRIHYAHLRDRALHTNILPTLHSLLEDPNGFLMAHAPSSGQTAERTQQSTTRVIDFDAVAAATTTTANEASAASSRGQTESSALLHALPPIPPSPAERSTTHQHLEVSTTFAPKPTAVASSSTTHSPSPSPSPTPSPRGGGVRAEDGVGSSVSRSEYQLRVEKHRRRRMLNASPRSSRTDVTAEPASVAPSPRAKTPVPSSVEKPISTDEITLVTSEPHQKPIETEERQADPSSALSPSLQRPSPSHTPTHKSSSTPKYGGAFGFSTYQDLSAYAYQERGVLPFTHSRRGSGSAAEGDTFSGGSSSTWYHGHHAFSPRVARTMSVITTSGAADDPVQHASSTCEYYGLNGETPLYPILPMEDATTRFSVTPSSALSASSHLNLITLDKLGPRRCTVHDLLQWILFQYPGSTYQLTELLPVEPNSPSAAAACSPASWSASHLCYAFLLFRGAYLESSQLVEWLSLAWDGSSLLPPHHAHHVRANVLWMVKVWVEYFRRDYLQTKEHVDAFLKQSVFPEAVRFEAEKERYSAESLSCCSEWTASGDTAKKEGPPRCINLSKLAVHISHIIALTSGQTTPAIAQFMENIPPEYLDASAESATSLTSPSSPESESCVASSSISPKPLRSRTATAPLQRRASFAIRGSSAHANSPDRAARPVTKVVLGSQAHRPPQCFAHRASTLLFVKKFVGLGGAGGSQAQSIKNWTPQQIAQELTNMDVEALQCIYTRELTHKTWTTRSPSLLSAHAGSASAFILSFNRRSFWTATEVLRAAGENVANMAGTPDGGLSSRLEVLVLLINVLEELLSLKNFYGAFAVLNGLGLQPLYRIKNLWAALPSRSVAQFESIKRQLDSKSNHAAYRSMVKQAAAKRVAHVPHFAVLLKDLFQLEELPTFVEEPSSSVPADDSRSSSSLSVSSTPPSQQLNWSKFAREYVEMHNSFLVAQNTVHLYERVQLLQESSALDGTEISEVFTPPPLSSSATFLTPSNAANNKAGASAAVSPVSPPSAQSPDPSRPQKPAPSSAKTLRSATLSSIPTTPVLRPALPPSEPSLRMCLHLSLARVWNEEKLYAFSYKLRPK